MSTRPAVGPVPAASLVGVRDDALGYVVTGLDRGRSRLRWEPPATLVNPAGFVHGGYIAMVVDNACGLAAVGLAGAVSTFPTVTMHVEFLRSVRPGQRYEVTGVVARAGRTVALADATIRDADGRLVARGACSFSVDLDGTDAPGFGGHDLPTD